MPQLNHRRTIKHKLGSKLFYLKLIYLGVEAQSVLRLVTNLLPKAM